MIKRILNRTAVLVCLMVALFAITGVIASAIGCGDVDGNGRISAADARLALRIAAKIDTADAETLSVADVNNDSRVTSADARLILRVSAGLETFSSAEDSSDEWLTGGAECTTKCPVTDENCTITAIPEEEFRVEDILGADVKTYISAFSLEKYAEGIKNKYMGEDTILTVRGCASTTPDVIDFIHTSRKNISVMGIEVGTTLQQAERLLAGNVEYFIESLDEQCSHLSFYVGMYNMSVLFNDGVAYIIFGGRQDVINYSVESLIDVPAESVFSGDVNNFTVTQNEDGTSVYMFRGMTATVCEKFGRQVVDRIVLEGESDFCAMFSYTGASAEEFAETAVNFGYTVTCSDVDRIVAEKDNVIVNVIKDKDIITRIEVESAVRPYKPGQCTDLSYLMDNHVTGVVDVTGEEPVAAAFDNNTWMFEAFYLTTEGCLSATPYDVCSVIIFAPGFGFAGIDFGMPDTVLTALLDEKGVNYTYDADAGLLRIAKGEYGEYSFKITTANGCVDWIEVSTEVYDGIYAMQTMLMTGIDLESEPFARLEKIEENGTVKLVHDCAELYLTDIDGQMILTGIAITKKCDFNFIGMFVGDDVTLIEAELIGCGFTDFTECDGCFRTSMDSIEITVYESMGHATRIEIGCVIG